MSIKSKIIQSGSILLGLLWISLMILFWIGISHAWSKHGAFASFSSLFPPVGLYYGLESYGWHDDFANVDWDDRLESDRDIVAVIIGANQNEFDASELIAFKEAEEKFKLKINKYPKKQYLHLKSFSHNFVKYNNVVTISMISMIDAVVYFNKPFKWEKDPEVITLEKELNLEYSGFHKFSEALNVAFSTLQVQFNENKEYDELPSEETKNKIRSVLDILKIRSAASQKNLESQHMKLFSRTDA